MLPSWLGLLGGWSWFLDLFSHFRWQYLAVAIVVLAIALWRRAPWVIAAASLTLLLNGTLIARLAWPPGAGSGMAPQAGLSVVSFNVLRINSRRQDVLAYLRAAGADVIFLMEVDAQWLDALQPLRATHPHVVAQPRADNFGIALFSRVPLSDPQVIWPGETGLPSLEAGVLHQGRELRLIGTHPPPPVGARLTGDRDRQLRALARRVEAAEHPVLLVGDLNATPWSRGLRLLTSGRLGFGGASASWKPTWRTGSMFAVPIDHALCTAPLVISHHEVGPELGSDHRPVAVTVSWAG